MSPSGKFVAGSLLYSDKLVVVWDSRTRTILAKIKAAAREGRKLSVLLNSKTALRPLFAYINATKRFLQIFGLLPQIEDDDDDD